MAITKTELSTIAVREVQALTSAYPIERVINQAGQAIVNVRRWRWLMRQSVTFAFTADQSYVDLPPSIERIVEITARDAVGRSFQPLPMATLAQYRTSELAVGGLGQYYYAMSHRSISNAAPTPVLELHPTPISAIDPAGDIYYHGGWHAITSGAGGDTQIQIPIWLEPLFMEVFIETCRGFEDRDAARRAERLAAVLDYNSALMKGAVSVDTTLLPNVGPLRGGQTDRRVAEEFYANDVVFSDGSRLT